MNKSSEPKLAPLKVTCTSSDCENGLHCFLATSRMKKANQQGKCRSCGVDLINWDRIHTRNLQDVEHTFGALKNEMIRHEYWHKEIDEKAIKKAHKTGTKGLPAAIETILKRAIGSAVHPWEGRQTPLEGNVIFYAQHATACCCRKCLEYWHGIPRGRDLEAQEIQYLIGLCMRYINFRMPNLPETGIPTSGRKKSTSGEPTSSQIVSNTSEKIPRRKKPNLTELIRLVSEAE